MRKLLVACGKANKTVNEIKGWRQWTHLYNGLRNLGHKASKLKKSNLKKHEEKVFSIFEEHTEWISKEKG